MENKITLRPYQQVIVEKTCKLLRDAPRFAYLSMEVRTGKTLTALSAIDCVGGISTVLFVTKKKAITGIQKDYKALGKAGLKKILDAPESWGMGPLEEMRMMKKMMRMKERAARRAQG